MAYAPSKFAIEMVSKPPTSAPGSISTIGKFAPLASSAAGASTSGAITIRPSMRPRIERTASISSAVSACELDTSRWKPSRAGRQVEAANDLGVEFAVEVGQQHAERVGPLRDQAARDAVRPVAQPRRHLAHAAGASPRSPARCR